MVGTFRPVSGGTETGRGREQVGSSSSKAHFNTPRVPVEDRNVPPVLRRGQFPKLSDDQWCERRSTLRRIYTNNGEGNDQQWTM